MHENITLYSQVCASTKLNPDKDPRIKSICDKITKAISGKLARLNRKSCPPHPEHTVDASSFAIDGIVIDTHNLSEIDMRNANLSSVTIFNKLENSEAVKATRFYITSVHFIKTDFSNSDLSGSSINHAILDEIFATNALFTECSLFRCTIKDSLFIDCNLDRTNLSNAIITNCELRNTSMIASNLQEANLTDSSFARSNLSNATITHANFTNANLTGTIFTNADASSANFSGATITGSDFTNISVDNSTLFLNARNPAGCRITRLTLSSLVEYGGLTVGNLSKMEVIDDVAKLRQAFGGPWFWTHLCLVTCFFLPYVCFVCMRLFRSYNTLPSDNQIPLGLSLWYYILSGGKTWSTPVVALVPFSSFILFSIYNMFRITLLWKTTKLENDQFVTKIPSDFALSTSRFWRCAYTAVEFLKYIAILVAVVHTLHFLTITKVPIDP